MFVLIFAALLILLAAGLYFFLILPDTSRQDECREFNKWEYAHRGLFSREQGIPENSLEAFRRAVLAGYAIELDVQLTRDKQLIVFHDDNLKRMCGENYRVSDLNYQELLEYPLDGTEYKIPLFTDVLELVDGKVPLLIEIKLPHHQTTFICSVINDQLRTYKGAYCIESFNPLVLKWYRDNCPVAIRGQLSTKFSPKDGFNALFRFMGHYLMFNFLGRPDFISYHYLEFKNPSFRLLRKLFHVPAMGWTVKSPHAYEKYRGKFDTFIFDSFIPEKDRKNS